MEVCELGFESDSETEDWQMWDLANANKGKYDWREDIGTVEIRKTELPSMIRVTDLGRGGGGITIHGDGSWEAAAPKEVNEGESVMYLRSAAEEQGIVIGWEDIDEMHKFGGFVKNEEEAFQRLIEQGKLGKDGEGVESESEDDEDRENKGNRGKICACSAPERRGHNRKDCFGMIEQRDQGVSWAFAEDDWSETDDEEEYGEFCHPVIDQSSEPREREEEERNE